MHDPASQTAIDMKNARSKGTIDVTSLTHLLHGSEEQWEVHQKVTRIVSNDPVFDKSRRPFSTRPERYCAALAIQKRLVELTEEHKWSDKEFAAVVRLVDDQLPINLHFIAFLPVIMSQGSPEQVAEYGIKAMHLAIVGGYAQTELGHGSNVAQLETTATYDPVTKEFDIHSPTLTSTKWWIGGVGKTATHCVVQAQLILPGGVRKGPHLFIIQLRSLEDHTPLPGIIIGDIGPKAFNAFAALDNGYIRFNHLRVKREAMLSKFAQVLENGEYVQPPHAKLSYGGMIYIRSSMITAAGWMLARGVTSSIRYCTVRRQGEKDAHGLERQAITYPSVHYRLLPQLAKAYVFLFLGRSMTSLFERMSSRLAKGDTSLLAETHAVSSGLKVHVSTQSIEGLEVTRRAMGGHGFSVFAGVGTLWAEHVPSATYEGDNFILDQQVVRAALKSLDRLSKSSDAEPSPSSYYLRHVARAGQKAPSGPYEWHNPQTAIKLLEWRAALMVQSFARNAKTTGADGGVYYRLSRAITEAFIAARVGDMITEIKLNANEKRVLNQLLNLYLLTTIEVSLADFLSFSLIVPPGNSKEPGSDLREMIAKLCLALLPEAIALTDAFGFSDFELNSALGVYDGRAYDTLWQRAAAEPLNQELVTDGYADFIKPMLEAGQKRIEKSKL
jgi:acyl-CoA oxidase